ITEEQFTRGTSGQIHWPRTVLLETKNAIPTENGIVYPQYRVKQHNETDKDLITEINKFCVYKSYIRLGWIYKLQSPKKPKPVENTQVYNRYLSDKILRTNVDKDKRLFQAMLDILNFENTIDDPEQFYFGTNNFEYIWERLIQATFGNVEKNYYFPRTKWLLKIGKNNENAALEPDTIMKESGDVFILDAKYYKYGVTRFPSDLPNSSSINKQISYGEYVSFDEKFEEERKAGMEVYNAFLMPYDSCEDVYNFEEKVENYYSIGEAVSDWKDGKEKYQRVQGILIDIKWLIKNSIRPSGKEIFKLSNAIKNSIDENKKK
ncbi:LlaJI family restriction endonuclease, partial [Anaerococcus porci]